MSIHSDMIQESQAGFHGVVYLNDTADHTGPYSKIRATEATVTNAITIGGTAITDDITLAIDQEIVGYITLIDLTSGAVLAYTYPEYS